MRILIVDDSALMRRWLKQCFSADKYIVDTARNGRDALKKVETFDPDVITLDVNMPEMDGLTCLSEIMAMGPRRVVMLSSLTGKGTLATLEALELGAIDYIEKPSGTVSHDIKTSFREIIAKVESAAAARVRTRGGRRRMEKPGIFGGTPETSLSAIRKRKIELVLIGVSTGGPGTLEEILGQIDPDISAPILIAQHMPGRFATAFAERLNGRLGLEVRAINGATPLGPGTVGVAGSDTDVTVSRRGSRLVAVPMPIDPARVWHPSVDRMVETALKAVDPRALLGVQLTGMGDDGAVAMADLHGKGGLTIAESEETAVIFGMPRELIRRGGASLVLPSHDIAEALNEIVGPRSRAAAANLG